MTEAEKLLWSKIRGKQLKCTMIYKISPNPSFPKRGRKEVKNDPHDYTKTPF